MPEQYQQWDEQCRKLNPDTPVMVWTDENIGELGLSKKELCYNSLAGDTNVVRLHAVYKHGGMYADYDFEPVKPLSIFPSDVPAWAARQADGWICCAIFGAEAGHPWVKWQMDNVGWWTNHNAEWGPCLMTQAPRDGLTLIRPELVYPFDYRTPLEERKNHPDTVMAHHWAKFWAEK